MADHPTQESPSEGEPEPARSLNYRLPSTAPPSSASRIGLFMLGLLGGVAVSFVVYAGALGAAPSAGRIAVGLVLAGKIWMGTYLARMPRSSAIGKGILCSIGMVVLLVGGGVAYLAYRCFNP